MTSKLVTLISVMGLVGTCVVNAQSPSPSGTPAASPSPAKHRTHKKAETSPAASVSTASPSPAEHRTHKKAAAAPSATPANAPTATPTPSKIGSWFKSKNSASSSPAASSTPATTTSTKAVPKETPAPGGGNGQVWVNTKSHVYHQQGSRFYGKTKQGKYMSEEEAIKEGDRAAAKGE